MPTKHRPNAELVDVSCEIIAETEKAYKIWDGDREEWLPKSQCQWDKDASEMTMPRWLALDKHLI